MKIVLGYIGTNAMWFPLETPSPIPAGWVIMMDGERPGDDYYASEDGRWLFGPSPEQRETIIAKANTLKVALIAESSGNIAAIQDEIEFDGDDGSLASLVILWKKYRIEVRNVDTSTAPDIDWPVKPE